jgi:hypothetical protein
MLEIKKSKTKTTACRKRQKRRLYGNFILGCSTKREILMIIPALIAM